MLADSVVSKPEIWLSVEDPLNSVEGSNTLTKGSVLKKNMELEATLHAEMEKNRCLEERNAKLSKEINELNGNASSHHFRAFSGDGMMCQAMVYTYIVIH